MFTIFGRNLPFLVDARKFNHLFSVTLVVIFMHLISYSLVFWNFSLSHWATGLCKQHRAKVEVERPRAPADIFIEDILYLFNINTFFLSVLTKIMKENKHKSLYILPKWINLCKICVCLVPHLLLGKKCFSQRQGRGLVPVCVLFVTIATMMQEASSWWAKWLDVYLQPFVEEEGGGGW